jgi:RNA polymerase sigma-70 factor (ECF subfamily)
LLQQAIACFDDVQAFRQLFILYQPSLLQFAISILKSKELSEEVVSDVFIRIWQKRQRLDQIENLMFYLFSAVKNRAITKLHEQKKHTALNIDSISLEFKSIYYDPEQKMISAEQISEIRACIRKLPPRCQLIFKLVKEDGLKYKEVAELLNLSIKTVENQIIIALKRIGSVVNIKSARLSGLFSKN